MSYKVQDLNLGLLGTACTQECPPTVLKML